MKIPAGTKIYPVYRRTPTAFEMSADYAETVVLKRPHFCMRSRKLTKPFLVAYSRSPDEIGMGGRYPSSKFVFVEFTTPIPIKGRNRLAVGFMLSVRSKTFNEFTLVNRTA